MNDMIMYCLLLVGFFLIRFSQAQLVQAMTPVNQTCLKYGHAQDCRFYSCFEERFPCGSNHWIMNWGYKYCVRIKKSLRNFDQNGQDFIQQVNTCLLQKLIQQRYYTMKTINCEQLRSAGQKIVRDCHVIHAKLFCSAFKTRNRDCFMQLMDEEDRQDLSILRTLANIGQQCTPKIRLTDMRSSGKMTQCKATSFV